jgi:tRNA(adenine34) deaminase
MLDLKINYFMSEALLMAELAYQKNEVPVGAVITKDDQIIGTGFNQVIANNSVISHAEIKCN